MLDVVISVVDVVVADLAAATRGGCPPDMSCQRLNNIETVTGEERQRF